MVERHNQSEQFLKSISLYDVHVTTKSFVVDQLYNMGAKKVIYTNQSYDEDFHFPRKVSEEDLLRLGSDVGFVGMWEKERMEDILYLTRNGTKGITDANYYVPQFAIVLTISYIVQNVRNTYNTMIQATGKYRDTQYTFVYGAVINIAVSIITVTKFGLVGVAIGTLVGAIFQMITQAWYIYKKILGFNTMRIARLCVTDTILISFGILITRIFPMKVNTYMEWIVSAIPVAFVWALLVIAMSLLLYGNEVKEFKKWIRRHGKNSR